MSAKKNKSIFFIYFLTPLIGTAAWAYYYSIDQSSMIALAKLLILPNVCIFIVGELLLSVILPKLNKVFKFGFWLSFFIVTPFYVNQIANQWMHFLIPLPRPVVYLLYMFAAIVSAIAIGLIILALFNIFFRIKKSEYPIKTIMVNLLIIILCAGVLYPLFGQNRAAQPGMLSHRTSYRDFVEREQDITPLHNVMVFGIDGADWAVIDPLMDQGKLPNLKKIMSEGRWGRLDSIYPLRSPVIWTTMFTGRSPESHGIVDWNISFSVNRLVKALWNILGEYNLRSTIINIPGTFPPEEFLGKEISGFPIPNQTMNNYGWILNTSPMNTQLTPYEPLVLKLDQDGSYKGKLIVSDILTDKYTEKTAGKIYRHKWLETVLMSELNDIYGNDIEVARFQYYQDDRRFDILPLKGNETPLATLYENDWSDFIPVQLAPGAVGLAKFKAIQLEKENVVIYVTPFFTDSNTPSIQFTFPDALATELTKMFGQYVVEITWMAVQEVILLPAVKELLVTTEDMKSRVGKFLFDEREWDLFIQIFSLTDRIQHPTWLFKYGIAPENRFAGSYNADLIERVSVGAIDEAYIKADIWLGDLMEKTNRAKDVVMILSDHGFQTGTGKEALFGVHRIEGVYAIWGGPVKPVSRSDFSLNKSESKSVNDIGRNILYLMGLPIGEDMVGEIWFDLYDESFVEKHPVKTIATYDKAEDEKAVLQRLDPSALEQLKGLGYLNGGGANVEGN